MTEKPAKAPCRTCGKRVCSCIEDLLAGQMRAAAFPIPDREYRFCPGRMWRFDFCFGPAKVAVEVEGAIWGGRHVRGGGFQADIEKYNAAATMGFLLIRVTRPMVESGEALAAIELALRSKGVRCGDTGAQSTTSGVKYPAH